GLPPQAPRKAREPALSSLTLPSSSAPHAATKPPSCSRHNNRNQFAAHMTALSSAADVTSAARKCRISTSGACCAHRHGGSVRHEPYVVRSDLPSRRRRLS